MESEAGNKMSRIKHTSDRVFDRILAEKGVAEFNGAQGRILHVLWAGDGIPLSELSDRTGLAKTTLTGMVDRMESAGLVCRSPDAEDRRRTLIRLTDGARPLRREYEDVSERMSRIYFAGFTDREVREFDAYLDRILANLEGAE